jgi:hypothetical protein
MTFTARASAPQTIALAGLAASSGLTVGRCSTAYDNSTNLDEFLAASGLITTGTSPTAGQIEVWVFAERADGSWPELFTSAYSGTDGGFTVKSRDVLAAGAERIARIDTDATSDRGYVFKPVDLARLLGGVIRKVATFVTHSTVANLNGTAGNHAIHIKPHYYA